MADRRDRRTGDGAQRRSDAGADAAAGERRLHGERRRDNKVRVAAVGDFHCSESDVGIYRDLFAAANDEADVLVLTGDLTTRGLAAEFKVVVNELADVKIPVVAVLGNHDFEAGETSKGITLLRARGVHLLNGDNYVLNERVGFAGVKGFMGGFGRGTLTSFGEPETKAFVGCAIDEVQKLELALRRLSTPTKIVVLHYAPVAGTVVGEPEIIYPFLGTDRLVEAIDRYGASAIFHGHVHSGTFQATTPGGIPVYNVSLPLLHRESRGKMYYLCDIPIVSEVPEGSAAGAPALAQAAGDSSTARAAASRATGTRNGEQDT
jgi:Icc-related predicted phosphoesterase